MKALLLFTSFEDLNVFLEKEEIVVSCLVRLFLPLNFFSPSFFIVLV